MVNRGLIWTASVMLGGQLLAPEASVAQKVDLLKDARYKMVSEHIEREGITNARVLDSLRQVPRHEFVDRAQRSLAYYDCSQPIGHKQTISPPFVVAYMTETLDPQPNDRVLEIGTGSGYQAAVLSNLVTHVYSIEIVEPLGRQAADRLKRLKYDNVTTKIGDGYLGWPDAAPFDKIIVTCSPESVPQPLVDQLKEGGKLLIPLGERYQQVFYLYEKKSGALVSSKLISTLFVPMTGKSEDQRQVKPDPLHPKILNGNFEDDSDHDGYADHWHYQRSSRLLTEGAEEGLSCLFFENATPGRMAQGLQASAIDGRKIGSLQMSLKYKIQQTKIGAESHEQPALLIHFYDESRRAIEDVVFGPWLGTTAGWNMATKTINVPAKTREMIIRIGLNGGTGKLWMDDIRLTCKPRS
ncbi:MAG: protein-L-isoaspartate(D-aspartate) O-methyltransferase [Planctomycetales bacterium]|nr:protein-L-isoaspartate(D-aspartate) O-methyltransferase [Planctomycetales bacterium]